MPVNFWPDCGWALLQPNEQGWLTATPAYFAAWLQRPELALLPESCAAETRLHRSLCADPLRPVTEQDLARLADADARDNYGHFLKLRDGLLQAGSLQAWLLALWRQGNQGTPPLFIDLVVQAVVRGLFEGPTRDGPTRDGPTNEGPLQATAFHARAAELLFRPQRISTVEGRLVTGDLATLDLQRDTHGFGDIGRLLAQAKHPVKTAQLRVLASATEAAYWAEAQRPGGQHRFLLDLTHSVQQELGHGLSFQLTLAHSGLKALAAVLQAWVQHLLGVAVRIEPLQKIDDPQWRWHVGLDAEASRLLNDRYEGHAVETERQQRLISLFRLDFVHRHEMRSDVAGKPVYLGLAMAADQTLRLKPHNLLLNLPLARSS